MSLDATKTEAKSFQPLLAERKSPDIAKLKYPVIASPKLDGVRCVTTNDGGRSRTLKPFPNMALDEALYGLPAWLDGELIYGEPNTEGVFNRTQSAVSTIEGTTEGLTYYVFDNADPADRHLPFISRLTLVRRKLSNLQGSFSIPIRLLEQRSINTAEELARANNDICAAGYEGTMIRNPCGFYKWGRSTMKEGILLKLKRWEDAEAEVIGFEEEMENTNEAETDERGYSKRAKKKALMVPKDRLGALKCSVNSTHKAVFNLGSGFSTHERQEIWDNREKYLGRHVTFKFQGWTPYGEPRFPIFKGFRNPIDFDVETPA